MPMRTASRAATVSRTPRRLSRLLSLGAACGAVAWGALLSTPAMAQADAPRLSMVSKPIQNSNLDGELFYQLFIGELELARGEPGTAYQVVLEAARRTRDEALFKRAVDIAISARAGEQALSAAKAWRQANPKAPSPLEVQIQLLAALGRPAEIAEPVKSLLDITPAADRPGMLLSLSRIVVSGPNATATATVVDKAFEPWRNQPTTRASALAGTARAWLVAGDTPRAVGLIRECQRTDPGSEPAALLALDLLDKDPAAEGFIRTYLAAAPKGASVRLSYARQLMSQQRYPQALAMTEEVTRAVPETATAWLMQGALLIELGRPRDAEQSLKQYLALTQKTKPMPTEDGEDADDGDAADEAPGDALRKESSQAYLMLAQAAEQQKDYAGAQAWLDQLGAAQDAPSVVMRRASLLARQGKLDQARALIHDLPDQTPDELRAKVMAETQLLRDTQAWRDADAVLVQALERLPKDSDLLYERALIAERLRHFDDMERLLRQVMALQPKQQHAYNALGYSFVDRNVRLEEGRALIEQALSLAPGDPFITDSLAWAEYRLGRKDEALRLLKQAYEQRADTEIAAHLGEVLWTLGQKDEARSVWRAGASRDSANEVLMETLKRLKVSL